MSAADLLLQEQHAAELRAHVLRSDGHEGAAYMLCGRSNIGSDPWSRRARARLMSHMVIPIDPVEVTDSGPDFITWSTESYAKLLSRAEQEGLVPAIVHAHPNGPDWFSKQDDRNEAGLAQMAVNRNGEGAALLSVLLTGEGAIRARLWESPAAPIPCDRVGLVGRRLQFQPRVAAAGGGGGDDGAMSRQSLAFGAEVTRLLRGLRIGIVGCGGTGSATAMLLARLGVGQLLLIDDDVVEVSNLNRLHMAKRSDADGMRPKAEVLASEIAAMGLGVRAVPFRGWVGHPDIRDGLRSSDVIFGCTDDHDGRMLLNRFASFYLIPVIDMGLVIAPRPELDGFRDCSGRVSVLSIGAPCLLCRGVVDPAVAREEDLRRRHPEEYDRQKREAYVQGAGNPAPAVVTFTTETAVMAVNELLQGLTGFRGDEGWVWNRVRRFDLLEDRRPGAARTPDCPVCGDRYFWGRGDVRPFLDRVG